jgi:hypothetical protein
MPIEDGLYKYWLAFCGAYDVIILDCQAGYSETTAWASVVADRKLIVLEPDAVSAAALRVLSIQLGYKLRSASTWQVFNKLSEDERPIYEKIAGGTLFPNLPPLPFDWQVRAAFGLREIPGVLSSGSAFGLGVLRIMRTLFPRCADRLAELEQKSVGDWYHDLSEKLALLRDRRDYLSRRNVELRRKQRARLTILLSAVIALIGLLFASYPLLSRFVPVRLDLYLSIIGSALVAASAGILARFQQNTRIEREEEESRQHMAKIDEDIGRFATLITTDPRLREYAKSRPGRYDTPLEFGGERPLP